ncbi:MAG: hypothetical protein K6T54_07370 [Ignavibacterium sp.]|nr:hypothetical protein [Ignavibacterium sp.]
MKYSGKYKIYRADSNDGNEPSSYTLIATINAYNGSNPVSTYVDGDVFVGSGQAKLYYKIKAVDNSNLESAFSLSDLINWDRSLQKKNDFGGGDFI